MLYKKNQAEKLEDSLFEQPTAEYRGAPFWAWNTMLDQKELDRQMEVLKSMGFGGAHLHPRTGLETPYLSEEFMDRIKGCLAKAKQENLQVYLYDEDRWPSGFAGGLVTKEEKYRAQYLLFTNKPYEAGEEAQKQIDSSARAARTLNGRLLEVYDVVLDEKGYLVSGKKLEEGTQPQGTCWYAYLERPLPSTWYNHQTYVNTLDKAAMDRFLEITHEAYAKEIGDEFGKTVPTIFTDEPQFSHKTLLRFPQEKRDVILPWTEDFAQTYQEMYQEDILEKLPELIWEKADRSVSTIRYHYHDHVTERFTRAFADNVGAWCKKHNIALTGHMMEEPTLRSQTAALGEAMRAYRSFELPGIDMLCDSHEYTTAKQAQSASHQFGREGVMSELYGVTSWSFDFRRHKLQGDWQVALGITLRVPHLSWVSMKGEAKRDYPASINYQSPWCKEYKTVEDHFARVNTAMTRGKAAVRVGVIHPIESYWLHWGPESQTGSIREQMEERFQNVTRWLLFGSCDFDFLDESLLPDLCTEAGNPLKVGAMSYDAVIIPGCETLRSTTIERLKTFARAGGKLILMGEAPTMTDAVPSNDGAELAALSRRIVFEKAALLEAVEPYRTLRLENEMGSLTNHYIYQLRVDQDCSWLFIAVGEPAGNPDFVKKDPVNIVLNGRFTVKEYDTMTGRIRDVKTAKRGAQTVINHIFYNQSSLLLKLMPVGEASGSVQAADDNDATQAAGMPGAMQAVSEASSTAESCAACVDSALAAALREQLLASGAAPKALPNRVAVTLSEPNVLLLDRAEFCMDGGAYQPAQELLRADNVLRSQLGFPARGGEVAQPWVLPEEKTKHFATLRFTVESEVEVPVRLALEEAEHASVKLNGKTVNEKVSGWYTDHCIGTIEIGTLQKGTNIVEATVPFTHRIGLEWCYLLGDFGVRIEGRAGVVTAPVRALSFGNIVPQGLPFYGGNITYHLPVSIGANGAVVHIPHYRGALVAVEKDGKRLGETTFAPYDLEVGQVDSIDLVLFGNRVNTFGAVHMVGEDDRFLNPGSWRTQDDGWSEEYVLQKVGILSAPVIVLDR